MSDICRALCCRAGSTSYDSEEEDMALWPQCVMVAVDHPLHQPLQCRFCQTIIADCDGCADEDECVLRIGR